MLTKPRANPSVTMTWRLPPAVPANPFAGAGIFLLLSVLGFVHKRRVSPDLEKATKLGAQTPAPVEP